MLLFYFTTTGAGCIEGGNSKPSSGCAVGRFGLPSLVFPVANAGNGGTAFLLILTIFFHLFILVMVYA